MRNCCNFEPANNFEIRAAKTAVVLGPNWLVVVRFGGFGSKFVNYGPFCWFRVQIDR